MRTAPFQRGASSGRVPAIYDVRVALSRALAKCPWPYCFFHQGCITLYTNHILQYSGPLGTTATSLIAGRDRQETAPPIDLMGTGGDQLKRGLTLPIFSPTAMCLAMDRAENPQGVRGL